MANSELKLWQMILIWLLCLLFIAFATSCKREKVITKEIIDTITISKTIKEPIHDTVYRVREKIVSLETTKHDTIEVVVPIEQKVYKDSSYTAYISGYDIKLDSLKVETKIIEKVITNEVIVKEKAKRKPWGVGLQGGYGIKGEPYLGIGISYNLINF